MLNLSPSLMCADQGHFADEVKQLEEAGATTFHIDIMDGEFVPNFALSWAQVGYCRKITNLKLEAHLMVKNLSAHLPFVYSCGISKVFIHFGHPQLDQTIKDVKSHGIEVGLVVDPGCQLKDFEHYLTYLNNILVMRVKPGFAGQAAIQDVDEKIELICGKFPELNVTVDGAVSVSVVRRLSSVGVKGFVLGTSALFGKSQSYSSLFNSMIKDKCDQRY